MQDWWTLITLTLGTVCAGLVDTNDDDTVDCVCSIGGH